MEGEPLAVQVYEGTTSNPVPVPEQVHTLRTRLGLTELVLGGDRGMVQAKGQRALTPAGLRSSTALTTPQGRRLLQTQGRRPAGCRTHGQAVLHGSGRLILRQRAALRQQAARRRAAQWATLQRLITARKALVPTSQRAKPEPGLRTLQAWGKRHKREAFGQVALPAGGFRAPLDTAAPAEATGLDGGDVWETDVPRSALDASPVHDRYRDLQEVAQDFRTMQTALLEVRPSFVRQAPRPRAPVLVTMWAVTVVREMRRALVAAFGTTDDDKMAVTVADAWVACARLCLLPSHVQDTAVPRLPPPDERQEAILQA
jgi:hypothetical protein